jgi:hypothetical protein
VHHMQRWHKHLHGECGHAEKAGHEATGSDGATHWNLPATRARYPNATTGLTRGLARSASHQPPRWRSHPTHRGRHRVVEGGLGRGRERDAAPKRIVATDRLPPAGGDRSRERR